jgi:DNA-binding CsgD family transcriptional regulator
MTTDVDVKDSRARLDRLSEKQKQVLDRLLLHQTSKEIARALDISPHTVEQRIRLAKEKLGVGRRSDLATEYRRLREVCDKIAYEDLRIDAPALPLPLSVGPVERTDLIEPLEQISHPVQTVEREKDVTLVPLIFQGRTGVLVKVGVIVAIAAATIIVAIGSMAMLEQLSRLLS